MSDVLAPSFRLRGAPATLEARALFRVHTAALHGPPAPAPSASDEQVVVVADEGGVIVYPSSPKLVILAVERKRLRGAFTF